MSKFETHREELSSAFNEKLGSEDRIVPFVPKKRRKTVIDIPEQFTMMTWNIDGLDQGGVEEDFYEEELGLIDVTQKSNRILGMVKVFDE